jgi:hypothetical protein
MTSDYMQLMAIFICSSLTLGNFPKYSMGKRSEESKGGRVPNLVWIQRNIPDPARNIDPVIKSAVLSLH